MGQQRLHQAIKAFGKERVEVEWKPFVIDPNTDEDGESVEKYCRRRWGGSGWTQHLKSEGRKDGGAKFTNWKVWPNTFKAHQLIQFCKDRGVSTDRTNQVLFQAEYEQGLNLSQVDTLVQLATEELGIVDNTSSSSSLREYLAQDQGKAVVLSEIREMSSKYGIRGVPYFIIRGNDSSKRPYGISGAQSSETLLELFQELADEEEDVQEE